MAWPFLGSHTAEDKGREPRVPPLPTTRCGKKLGAHRCFRSCVHSATPSWRKAPSSSCSGQPPGHGDGRGKNTSKVIVSLRLPGPSRPSCRAGFANQDSSSRGDNNGLNDPSLPLTKTELSARKQSPFNTHPQEANLRVCEKHSPCLAKERAAAKFINLLETILNYLRAPCPVQPSPASGSAVLTGPQT